MDVLSHHYPIAPFWIRIIFLLPLVRFLHIWCQSFRSLGLAHQYLNFVALRSTRTPRVALTTPNPAIPKYWLSEFINLSNKHWNFIAFCPFALPPFPTTVWESVFFSPAFGDPFRSDLIWSGPILMNDHPSKDRSSTYRRDHETRGWDVSSSHAWFVVLAFLGCPCTVKCHIDIIKGNKTILHVIDSGVKVLKVGACLRGTKFLEGFYGFPTKLRESCRVMWRIETPFSLVIDAAIHADEVISSSNVSRSNPGRDLLIRGAAKTGICLVPVIIMWCVWRVDCWAKFPLLGV